ncbi:hypothetical protein HN695_06550 [Candidatus Woesearchaeota archaeon]|jgi:hypothetical protein|nr:hypothetical protein [Candidatus Woesearchaeota archaeon]MBT5272844.1 hypothetical protein [Candidatus Woesearchaeota archaeon]MBT6040456.1 hypothetical protein [Candidatus Woesearchaeota archaeon]MBT6336463.1 hypothetical protein [Candidatus Woesearchaeota archaeon]MBT7927967.1 hypothetical protein [Candidatus Woesearchaeota archaeon]
MKLTVKEFVEAIDEEELYKLQYDLTKGAVCLKQLVGEKVKAIENEPRKNCAVCGEELVDKEGTYSLIFRHEKLKKKASFCAVDCMEFFISKLKKAQELNAGNISSLNTQKADIRVKDGST